MDGACDTAGSGHWVLTHTHARTDARTDWHRLAQPTYKAPDASLAAANQREKPGVADPRRGRRRRVGSGEHGRSPPGAGWLGPVIYARLRRRRPPCSKMPGPCCPRPVFPSHARARASRCHRARPGARLSRKSDAAVMQKACGTRALVICASSERAPPAAHSAVALSTFRLGCRPLEWL